MNCIDAMVRPRKIGTAAALPLALLLLAASLTSSAAAAGTTAATCHKVGSAAGNFKTEHCKEGDGDGEYAHVPIAQDTETEVTGSNGKTNADTNGPTSSFFHVVINGIELEIRANAVSASGSLANKVDATSKDHYAHGVGVVTYEEVSVVKPEVCTIESKVVTKELTATTLGQGMGVKVQPKEGTTFAEFNTAGGSCPEAVKGSFKVTGSIILTPEGATLTSTRAASTAQGTLKARNVKAGLDGKITLSGKDKAAGDSSSLPLSTTTVSGAEEAETAEALVAAKAETDETAEARARGTTAATCHKVGAQAGKFKTAHCKEGDGDGEYAHVPIDQNTETEVSASTEKTTADTASASKTIFHTVITGIELRVQASTVSGSGSMLNKHEVEGEEHYVEGEGSLTYSGLTVLEPSSCAIEASSVVTKVLKVTTTGQGLGVKLQPKEGTTFAEFNVIGAACPEALKGNYKVTGSVILTLEGATLTSTREGTTAQATLKARNVKAGLETKMTLSGKDKAAGDSTYLPLSATTVSKSEEAETAEALEAAEAETKGVFGTTGFTCGPKGQPNGDAGFSKSHCKPSDAVGTNAAYGHVAIGEGTTTEVLASNKGTGAGTEGNTPLKLRATIAGIDTEIQATGVSGSGTMENMLSASEPKEHTISGAGSLALSGVTVTRPEGGGCKVKGGEFSSKELKATSAGQGDGIKFEPASGTLLASFEVEGCSAGGLNGVYEVKGTIKGTPEGATIAFTEEGSTIQNTMTMRNVPAGLEGLVTIAGRVKGSGSNYTDISATTVETKGAG